MWKIILPGLIVVLMVMSGGSAESVAPRFPDAMLLSPTIPESDVQTGQGQEVISGRLLEVPCVLTAWVGEMTVHTGFMPGTRQVILQFEGCGGRGHVGLSRNGKRDVPFPVKGVWSESGETLSLRFRNGTNYLSLPATMVDGIMGLEMTYE